MLACGGVRGGGALERVLFGEQPADRFQVKLPENGSDFPHFDFQVWENSFWGFA